MKKAVIAEQGAELKWNSEADEHNQWNNLAQDERDQLISDFISAKSPSLTTMKTEPTNAERLPGEYLACYRRAMDALHDVIDSINAMPVPGSESVTWGSVADMSRIANDLEAVTRYTR